MNWQADLNAVKRCLRAFLTLQDHPCFITPPTPERKLIGNILLFWYIHVKNYKKNKYKNQKGKLQERIQSIWRGRWIILSQKKQEAQRDEVLKEENVQQKKNATDLNAGKYWQSDRLCKVFRPCCLCSLCFSPHGVLSFKIRLLCLRRATPGPPGPCKRKWECMPNCREFQACCAQVWSAAFFLLYVYVNTKERIRFYRSVFLWVCEIAWFWVYVWVHGIQWIWRGRLPYSFCKWKTGPHWV